MQSLSNLESLCSAHRRPALAEAGSKQIRGISASHIRRRLHAFCCEAGHCAPRTTYVLTTTGQAYTLRALVSDRARRKRLWDSCTFGPPLFIRLGISRATLSIKNNARLFYTGPLEEMRSAKIALPSAFRSGSLAREIWTRKYLARRVNPLLVPSLVRYGHQLDWIEEEFLPSEEQISDAAKVGIFLHQYGFAFYAQTKRSRPLGRTLQRYNLQWPEIENVLAEVGVRLDAAAGHDASWPVALVHGDLSPGNMRTSHGVLFVIDWEQSHVGSVASDLTKLFLMQPGPVLALLRLLSHPDDMMPTAQMQIALAIKIIGRRRNREALISYFMRNGRSRSKAIRRVLEKERELLDSMAAARSNARY